MLRPFLVVEVSVPSRTALCLLLCALAFPFAGAVAQTDAELEDETPKPTFRRVSFGMRFGLNASPDFDVTQSNTVSSEIFPIVTNDSFGASNSGRFMWGPALQLAIHSRVSLNAEVLFRSFGYNRTFTEQSQQDEFSVPQLNSQEVERVNGRFLSIPVVVRYYLRAPGKPRPFFGAGMTMLRTRKVTGTRQVTVPGTPSESEPFDVPIANSSASGVTVVAGLQLRDDVGIKVDIEFRRTQWSQRAIDTPLVRNGKSENMVMIGLTF